MNLIEKIIFIKNILLTKLKYKLFLKKIGKNTVIEKPILFKGKKNILISDNVYIRQNSRIEVIEHFKNQYFKPKLIIQKNVNIEQNFHCTCAGEIIIGENTSITPNVAIFNINHSYKKVNISPKFQDYEIKNIIIGKNCMIGTNTVILPGTEIGDNVIIGANSVVKGKICSNTVIGGNPAKIIKKYNFKTHSWERMR
ncbi:Acetyltransferase (isoleucine patch superfamily) [Cetobacterium ceti]|uniref:Acetyltransferase (Isoleucine patch superfamily) n=1 Tax=Cetobacterium ceti TaxID=180163 RepID=A0A1T4LSY3_9FUSO|nr:acyltransferase [Cetobacterium ceti]SJZ57813.1 Acetyltransferase (isoleucine patch superfamily) [Cetobacterium ceti]